MRRRTVAAVLVCALLPAGAVVGLAGRAALSAADDLEQAQDRLAVVRQPATTTEQALAALRGADGHVDDAVHSLDAWPVDLVAAVPLLGRSWDAERAVARTAAEVISGAQVLADALPALRASAGGIDLAGLSDVRTALAGPSGRSRRALERLEAAPTGMTPPQVHRGVVDARVALAPAVRTLDRAGRGLGVLEGLLGGDGRRSVLVMLQNNAELRGTGGYAASFATGHLESGRLELGPLRDVLDVADPPEQARRVPAPAEYLEDYEHLSGNTTIWRSWNMTPNVPDAALVSARVAGALLPEQPDVVVLLDVPAMSQLVGLGGQPVALPDGTVVPPDQLRDALLVDAYADAGEDAAAQVRRRRALQSAATSAVTRLLAGQVALSEVARSLEDLAAQRHLSLWSAEPDEQRTLVDLGLAGAVAPPPHGGDLSHVSVNNIGSNKLDYYVRRELEVEAVVGQTRTVVTQRVRFTNEAPAGLVPYVAGFERPGVVISRVELSLPPEAADLVATVDGRPLHGTLASGGARQRLSMRLEVPRGTSTAVEVRYAVPLSKGDYRLRLVPQPLLRDAALRLRIGPAEGVALGRADGARLVDGAVEELGSLSEVRDVRVSLQEETLSRWERLRRWWNSPVEIG